MARRRTTLTTRGVVALSIVPLSAVAGLLLGAEELVLLSLALLTLVAAGLVQSAHRAALTRGRWQVTAALSSIDAEVGSRATLRVTLDSAATSAVPFSESSERKAPLATTGIQVPPAHSTAPPVSKSAPRLPHCVMARLNAMSVR